MSLYPSFPYPQFRYFLQAVRLVLVLLDLGDDLGHLPPLREVDEARVVQEVGVALLQEQDVALVLPEEGNAPEEGQNSLVIEI